jgi:hypothetical protein
MQLGGDACGRRTASLWQVVSYYNALAPTRASHDNPTMTDLESEEIMEGPRVRWLRAAAFYYVWNGEEGTPSSSTGNVGS